MRMHMFVFDIPRNDIAACERYWREHEITGEDWRVMVLLQDDPAALIKAAKRWPKRLAEARAKPAKRSRPRARR